MLDFHSMILICTEKSDRLSAARIFGKIRPGGWRFPQKPEGPVLAAGGAGQVIFASSIAWLGAFCHFLGYHLFFISPVP